MYRSGCPKSLYDDTTMILCGILFRCMEGYLTLVNVNVIYVDASLRMNTHCPIKMDRVHGCPLL